MSAARDRRRNGRREFAANRTALSLNDRFRPGTVYMQRTRGYSRRWPKAIPPQISAGLTAVTRCHSIRGESDLDLRLEYSDEASEDIDLPPSGLAFVLFLVDGFLFSQSGFAPGSTIFLLALGIVGGGIAILAWVGILYKSYGLSEAYYFLTSVD